MAKRDLWETLADYPEARTSLTERGCQLLRKDGLLDEEQFASKFFFAQSKLLIEYSLKLIANVFHHYIFLEASSTPDTVEDGMKRLEMTLECLNDQLANLVAECELNQIKLNERIEKLETR